MRTRNLTVIVSVLVLGSLVGCTPAASPEPTPTAAADTAEERVQQFADALCPAVAADTTFNEVWENQDATIDEIVSVAVTARDEGARAVEAVDGLIQTWPSDLRPELELVRDLYVAKAADYSQIADASTLDDLTTVDFGDATAGNDAAQRIADALGSSTISCE